MTTQGEAEAVELLECGHPESPHSDFTRGYGRDAEGNRYCYACCAERDKADMRERGRIALYLSPRSQEERDAGHYSATHKVTNWPGSLVFLVYGSRRGWHNWAGPRYDVWFTFEGEEWHGVQYGDNTQIVHCKRTKRKAR